MGACSAKGSSAIEKGGPRRSRRDLRRRPMHRRDRVLRLLSRRHRVSSRAPLHACSPEIPPAALQAASAAIPAVSVSGYRGPKRTAANPACRARLHFLLRPAALGTDRHEHGKRRGATVDRLAQSLGRTLQSSRSPGRSGSAIIASKERRGLGVGRRVLPTGRRRTRRCAASAPLPPCRLHRRLPCAGNSRA